MRASSRNWVLFDVSFYHTLAQVYSSFKTATFVLMTFAHIDDNEIIAIVHHRCKLGDVALLYN